MKTGKMTEHVDAGRVHSFSDGDRDAALMESRGTETTSEVGSVREEKGGRG